MWQHRDVAMPRPTWQNWSGCTAFLVLYRCRALIASAYASKQHHVGSHVPVRVIYTRSDEMLVMAQAEEAVEDDENENMDDDFDSPDIPAIDFA